ncbi:hypothetical protein AB0E83_08925 [Streptomyces sp. NPDC035033]|uniref:hypothetical protein n=1 Tax=Streptomyces sp. NPDC035033 TaxID=3155368 RepID=UPI0033D2DED2
MKQDAQPKDEGAVMVEELAEVVARAAGWTARGVTALLSIPETYSAAAEYAAAKGERPRARRDDGDGRDDRGAKSPGKAH